MNFKLLIVIFLVGVRSLTAGTLVGHVRDQNWYAQYQTNVYGVGYYEFAVNANATDLSSLGGFAGTDVYGAFQMSNLTAGVYTVASWDVWWRSAYGFNVSVPSSGNTPDIDLRLKSTMWGYPAFWDTTGYFEFGQTFIATGPISMIYLRCPFVTNYTLSVRLGGPGGARVPGSSDRSFNGSDNRVIYGYGDMPTVAVQTYYVRIRTPASNIGGVIMQMDPRPDFSDPMPGGCLWLGDGVNMVPYPDRDLGLIIMSDDDGLITNLYARQSGGTWSANSIGQTFIARGVNLISAAAWLADPSAPIYVVRVLQDGPGGAQVGTSKRGKPARLNADPEMLVTWAPGECPLTPGQTYYLEVTKDGGGTFNVAYVNTSNPYPFGDAYKDGVIVPGTDLAGTIMEEAAEGSAAMPSVRVLADPSVPEVTRRSNQFAVQWVTDLPSDSLVEYAVENPPYASSQHDTQLVTNHSVLLTNLQSHTMYHYRATSTAANRRPAVTRDFVICTRESVTNLLVNPSFESGSGPSPRSVIPGWTFPSGVDIKASSGNDFWSLPPHTPGGWFLQYSVNGSSSDAYISQRVSGISPGLEYTFSAWVMTAPRENGAWKYDVWNNQGRLIYMRLGIDPTGGTNVAANSVQWTPRMYSHLHYSNLAKTVLAQSTNLTVFISMKGTGEEWHLYGVDDCVLSQENIPTRLTQVSLGADGSLQAIVSSRANRTNEIDSSGNLRNWSPLTNILNRTGLVPFTDSAATNFTQRYYRARLVE